MKTGCLLLSCFLLAVMCVTAPVSLSYAEDTQSTASVGGLAYHDYPTVRLRSLDKITARTMTFDAQVGSIIRFGDIYIKIQACRKPPAIEKSESASFLQIWEVDKKQDRSRWIFSGWMFASSPALSAMDHPVYDVWVIDCLGQRIGGGDDEEEAPAQPSPAEDLAPNDKELPGEGEVSPDQAPAAPKSTPEQTLATQPTPQPPSQPMTQPEPEEPKPAVPQQTDQLNAIY